MNIIQKLKCYFAEKAIYQFVYSAFRLKYKKFLQLPISHRGGSDIVSDEGYIEIFDGFKTATIVLNFWEIFWLSLLNPCILYLVPHRVYRCEIFFYANSDATLAWTLQLFLGSWDDRLGHDHWSVKTFHPAEQKTKIDVHKTHLRAIRYSHQTWSYNLHIEGNKRIEEQIRRSFSNFPNYEDVYPLSMG